ncbi:MAG: ribulose-phosphate 3-epimerase [Candidatus Omnitrophica bacterium]|nr:ribulose-phosphate 3-epimerase [Candidatus Omnitrophota bacterium]
MKDIRIAPSLLSADFSCLGEEIRKIELAGADMVHIDVMDGQFVPNISIGPVVIKDIRKVTKLPLDVHLMIQKPLRYVDNFIQAGSDMITMHVETISERLYKRYVSDLKLQNIKFGISLNPDTPLKKIIPFLSMVDFVLVMSVNPGFSGQKFVPQVLPKIRRLRDIFKGDIAVDGGINHNTAKSVVKAGANILAAGSYIFNSADYKEAIGRLRECSKKDV